MGDVITDRRLVDATGHGHTHWFKQLDAAGAQAWDHHTIARWLGTKNSADSWWARALAHDYIRARGPAMEGSGVVTASKTIRHPRMDIWPFVDDDELRRAWLDCEISVRGRTPGRSLRMQAADGSRIEIALTTIDHTAHGEVRTRVTVTHSRLPDTVDMTETHAFWKACLESLARLPGSDTVR